MHSTDTPPGPDPCDAPPRGATVTEQVTDARRADASPTTTTSSGNASADKVFAGLAYGAGGLILLVLAFVAIFLVTESLPALAPTVFSNVDSITSADNFCVYVAPLIGGTIMASAIAILLATPVAIGIALFFSHYAPRKLATPVGYVIDLLAAIPS